MSATKHALLAPSASPRWMTCAGSVAMCEGLNTSSEDADSGTASHTLAAMCLIEGKDALAFLGRRIVVDHRTFEVDEERCEAVQVYLDYVRTLAALPGATLLVEQALPVSHITGEEGAEGTGDAVVLLPDELIVVDLKYGRGVPVFAKDNKQLKLYALGALEKFGMLGDFKRFRLVISQPRVNTAPDEWDCSLDELLTFATEAGARGSDALFAYKHRANWLGKSESYLVPSDEGCRFCPAKATCSALAKFVQTAVGAEFDVIQAAAPAQNVDAVVTDSDLAAKMKACDLVEDWIRAVRAEVERRLLAAIPVSGYKLVQGRQGNRTWSDEAAAEEMLRKRFRLPMEDAYKMTVISPTQAEKVLKEKPKQWKAILPLIVRPDGKLSVAPEADKRAAYVAPNAETEFEVVSDLV